VVTPAHIPVRRLNAGRQPIGLLPAPGAVKIPSLRAGSFSLWSQRHQGVPGTPPGTAASNSQNADNHSGIRPDIELCKTNPIWPGRRRLIEEIVQNEPNFASPQAADGGSRAEQSQTWGDWGMRAKAVVMWDVARPDSETRKTNPIWPGRRRAGGQMCKTNPICPAGPGGTPSTLRPRAPAESGCAKRTQFSENALRRHYKRAEQTQFAGGRNWT
jgi:hypothetical protein